MVHVRARHEEPMVALVERWDRDRRHAPARSQVILAYTRADVAVLNDLARQAMGRGDSLEDDDMAIRTERGTRQVAVGDRLMFLRNDRELGAKNGVLGTLRGGRARPRPRPIAGRTARRCLASGAA